MGGGCRYAAKVVVTGRFEVALKPPRANVGGLSGQWASIRIKLGAVEVEIKPRQAVFLQQLRKTLAAEPSELIPYIDPAGPVADDGSIQSAMPWTNARRVSPVGDLAASLCVEVAFRLDDRVDPSDHVE